MWFRQKVLNLLLIIVIMISTVAAPDFLGQMGLLICVLKPQISVLLLLSFCFWLLYSAFPTRHAEGKSHLSSLVLCILPCFTLFLCSDGETSSLAVVLYFQIVVYRGRMRGSWIRQALSNWWYQIVGSFESSGLWQHCILNSQIQFFLYIHSFLA